MKKNLISISQFCSSNNVSIQFLPTAFLVKELRTRATLLRGPTKDGVYEWPVSPPLLAFSSIKTSLSEWHHRLGHPAFPILKHIVSMNKLGLSSSSSSDFSCNACLRNKSHKLSFSQSTIVSSQPLETIFSDVGLPQSYHMMALNIMSFLLIISQNISGFILLNKNQKSKLFSLDLKPLLKNTLIRPSKLFTLTMVVNT